MIMMRYIFLLNIYIINYEILGRIKIFKQKYVKKE